MGKRVTDPNQSQTEFIFGSLSTASGRIQRARSLNAGLQLAPHLAPIDPRPGELTFTHIFGGVSSSALNYGRVKWRKWCENG